MFGLKKKSVKAEVTYIKCDVCLEGVVSNFVSMHPLAGQIVCRYCILDAWENDK